MAFIVPSVLFSGWISTAFSEAEKASSKALSLASPLDSMPGMIESCLSLCPPRRGVRIDSARWPYRRLRQPPWETDSCTAPRPSRYQFSALSCPARGCTGSQRRKSAGQPGYFYVGMLVSTNGSLVFVSPALPSTFCVFHGFFAAKNAEGSKIGQGHTRYPASLLPQRPYPPRGALAHSLEGLSFAPVPLGVVIKRVKPMACRKASQSLLIFPF